MLIDDFQLNQYKKMCKRYGVEESCLADKRDYLSNIQDELKTLDEELCRLSQETCNANKNENVMAIE